MVGGGEGGGIERGEAARGEGGGEEGSSADKDSNGLEDEGKAELEGGEEWGEGIPEGFWSCFLGRGKAFFF